MIKRIGKTHISEKELYQSIYKSLGMKARLNKTINADYLKKNTTSATLLYHPFWMVKNLVLADRPPFPPKKIPRMIFIDAVSGYRGIFSHVPPVSEEAVDEEKIVEALIREEAVDQYAEDVRAKQIDKQYLLKKPRHEALETALVYLPIHKVVVESAEVNKTFYINGNTGESEQFLSERWKNGKDLIT